MYTVLTANNQMVKMQLRSHGLFSPEASDLLADLLRRMQDKLLEEQGGAAWSAVSRQMLNGLLLAFAGKWE
jgi:hypothetical protein